MRLFKLHPGSDPQKEGEKTIDGIVEGSSANRVLSLRSRLWKIEIDPKKLVAFFSHHRKNLSAVGALLLALFVGVFYFYSSAEVTTFYPTSCLGGWDNPKNAEGEPTLKKGADPELFTKENSAILSNSNAEFYCGGFEGAIPDKTLPSTAVLHLIWSVDNGEINHENSAPSEQAPGTDSVVDTPNELTVTSEPEIITPSENVPEGISESDTPPSEPTVEPESALEPAPEPESEPQLESFIPLVKIARAQEEGPISETAPEVVSEPSVSIAEDVSDSTVESTIETTEPAEETEIVALPSESEESTPTPQTPLGSEFMEIAYTEDGMHWQSLLHISRADWQTGEYTLPVDLKKWDDIDQFQIRLTPLSTIDAPPVVYLDGMAITVSYDPIPEPLYDDAPTVKIIDPSLDIVSNSDGLSDTTPVFTVTDPGFSTAEIKDLIDEGKAEVIDDKEGVFDEKEKSIESFESIKDSIAPLFESTSDAEPSVENPPPDGDTSSDGVSLLYQKFQAIAKNVRSAAVTAAVWHPSEFPDFPNMFSQTVKKNARSVATNPTIHFFSPKIAHAQTVIAPVEVTIFDSENTETDIDATITTTFEGGTPHYHISVPRPREFRPGRYRMHVILHSNNVNIVSEQNFSWGVLSINIDRSVETPGKQAHLEFGVLDDTGNTICNSDLRLKITGPTGTEYIFDTDNDTIIRSPECGPNNVIEVPDYYAEFTVPSIVGTYQMVLTGLTTNGERTISDNFIVEQNPILDVRRVTATRIQPLSNYPVTMYITSPVDWTGTIIEKVPASFGILPPQNSTVYSSVQIVGDAKVISWNNVTLSAGEVKTIGYYYDAPDISPEFYLLGPAIFKNQDASELFREARSWQIASDGSCQTTAGPTGNWSTAGTWTGTCTGTGGKPGTGDTVTINAGFTVTMDEASAAIGPLTVNGTLDTSGTNYGLSFTTLSIGSAGTLTANGSAITVTGTSGTLLTLTSGGTYTGGSAVVTVNGNGSSTLNGGTGAFTGNNKLTTLTLNRNAVTYTLGADLEVSGTTTITLGTLDTSNSGNYALSTGKISIANSASAILNARASVITITGNTSTLFARGANGVFTQGTSEVKVLPTDANATGITFLSGTETFHKLTIDASNLNVLNAGAVITMSSADAANKLYIKSGVLNDGGNQIAGTANGTLVIDASAALCIGGRATGTAATCGGGATPTTATTFPTNYTNGNITLAATSTVYYNFNASAGVSIVPTYGNLVFRSVLASTDKTYTIDSGTLTVTGDWDIFPQAGSALKLTVSMSGAVVVTGTTRVSHGNSSGASGSLLSTNNNALTTGFIILGTGGCGSIAKCTLDAGSSTITLTGTSGTLYTRSTNAVFTQGTSEVIVTSASGTPTLLSVAATFHRLTINSAATVINAGAVITMSSTDAANRLYIQAGVLNDGGSQIAGTANGTLVIDGGAMLCIGGTAGGTNATCNSGATIGSAIAFPTNYTNGNITLAATSTVAYLGDLNMTISSTPTYGNLTFLPTITSARSYTFSAAATINGNFTINPSAASSLALTAKPLGNITVAAGKTTTIQGTSSGTSLLDLRPSATDYDLSTGLINIASGGTLDATSAASTITLTGTSGTLWTQAGTFTITSGTPLVTLSGNGDATVNSGTPTFYGLTSSGTGTKTLGGDITVNNVFTISAGTFGGGSSTITLAGTTGTPFANSATFSPGTGTVSYTGANSGGNTTIETTGTTYYNLTVNASDTFNPNGTVTGDSLGVLTVTLGTFDTTGSNHSISFGRISIANSASAILTANASTIALTEATGDNPLFKRLGSGVFNADTSTVTMAAPEGIEVTINSGTVTFNNLTLSGIGTKSVGSSAITITGTLTISAGYLNPNTTTITGSGTNTLSVTNSTIYADSSTFAGSYASFETITLGSASTVDYNLAGTQTVDNTLSYVNLRISTSGTKTLGGNTTVTGSTTVAGGTLDADNTSNFNLSTNDMTIGASGTHVARNSTITVTRNWSNAGAFTAGGSTVLFNGATTAAIGGGPTTFYNLTITHTSAKEVNFSTTALHIIHVTNLFSVTGASGQLIKLYSSSGGTKWHFHPTGTAAVDYADVKDGGCESGAITVNPTHTTDSLNNESCWSFFSPTATFAISDNTIGFGTLSSSAARYATGDLAGDTSQVEAHTLSATTNAPYGYTLLINGTTLTSGGNTITAIGGTNTASSVGSSQYGIRLTATGGSGAVSAPYTAAGFALDTGSFPDEIASASTGDGVATTYSVRYLANISNTLAPGSYTSTLTYIMVPNF